jgi:hypothetical protein
MPRQADLNSLLTKKSRHKEELIKTGEFGGQEHNSSHASLQTHQQLMDSRSNFREEKSRGEEKQYSTSPMRARDKNDGLASYATQQRKGLVEPSKHSDYYGTEEPV